MWKLKTHDRWSHPKFPLLRASLAGRWHFGGACEKRGDLVKRGIRERVNQAPVEFTFQRSRHPSAGWQARPRLQHEGEQVSDEGGHGPRSH